MNIFLFGLELLATFSVFFFFLHCSLKKGKMKWSFFSLIVVLYLILHNFPIPETVYILPSMILLFEGSTLFKISVVSLYVLLDNLLGSIFALLYCCVTGEPSIDFNCYSISFYLLTIGSCVLIYLFHSKKEPFSSDLSKKSYILIIFVCIFDLLLTLITDLFLGNELNKKYDSLILVFVIFLVICMSLLILFLYFKLQHYHIALQQTAELNQRALKLEELHYAELQQKNEDLRAFRHDYNHHILAMQELAKQENYNALTNYIQNLSQVKEQTYYLSTNHAVADAIVNYFYERLPEQTQFQLLGKFSKPFLVEDSDLCTILSNLIKNAVEATRIVSNNTERKDSTQTILLEIGSDLEHAQIMIENSSISYSAQELERLNTSKVDGINHGFGLRNVKQVVKKYHGTMDIRCENGIFSVCIFLST